MNTADPRITSDIAQRLADTGSVTIDFSRRNAFKTLGITGAVAIVIFLIAYAVDAVDGAGAAIMTAIVIAFLLFIWFLLDRMYHGKKMVIDREGVTIADGQFIPWADIDGADIKTQSRGTPHLRLQVSEPAWQEYIANQSAIGRAVSRLNKAVLRKPEIYLHTHWDADSDDVVQLISFMAHQAQGAE